MILTQLSKTWNVALRNNAGLLISNILLTVLLFISVNANLEVRDRVILTPPHMDKKMEVSWKSASSDYMKSWGLYVATLIGNITPKNVNMVADAMGAFLDPSIYPRIRSQIISLAEDPVFQRANAINYFSPDQAIFEVDPDGIQKVFVVGQLITSGFDSNPQAGQGKEIRNVVYEMTMIIRDGRPVITDFTSYSGNQPHTQKWQLSQQGSGAVPKK